MPISSSSFMVEETGACVRFAVQHSTVIATIELEVQGHSLTTEASSYVIWALTEPRRGSYFADGFYTVALPVPLGHLHPSSFLPRGRDCHTAVLPLGRWEAFAKAHIALVVAPATADVACVRRALVHRLRPERGAVAPQPMTAFTAVRWRLCGTEVVKGGGGEDEEAEWRPLLHCRWYELKSSVREGTVVPYSHSNAGASAAGSESDEEGQPQASSQPMYAGDVKEAVALSVNGQCVLWEDGGVGLVDEVKPFSRVYAPARQEKTIRVRRFPHRYADVIGEVPFGQCVEAFGRCTDPFTQEQYVLLYLPSGAAFAQHSDTYELAFVEEGRYVWGWSKVAGSSGLPLLTERYQDEMDNDEAGRSAAAASTATMTTRGRPASPTAAGNSTVSEVMELPEATFYTPVRDGRAVRIRRRPTLTSATQREMEANEVRAAVALLTVQLRLPADPTGPLVPHVFVQWQQGGYSLLRNETECFLAPVMLSRVPRRFPIRTCSTTNDDEAEAVIDLSRQRPRKRGRSGDDVDAQAETEAELQAMLHPRRTPYAAATAAARSDATLLSPSALPASLQEALQRGVVRLEDLPALRGADEESDEGSEDEDSVTDSDDSDDF